MERLGHAETRRLLSLLQVLYMAPTTEVFVTRLLTGLGRVVSSDVIAFNEVDALRRVTHTWMNPAELHSRADEQVWAALCHEHPYLGYRLRTGRLEPLRLSDLTSIPRMSRTALWNELLAPKGLEHQIIAGLPAPRGCVTAFTVCRSRRDFSERDRLVVTLVRPHVVAAYQHARGAGAHSAQVRALVRGIEDLGAGVVLLDPDGRIALATTQARATLAAYVRAWRSRGRRLPEPIASWVVRELRALSAHDRLPEPRRPLVLRRHGACLVIRIVTDDERYVLLLEERREGLLDAAILTRLGLTRREADVLAWVAEGKTNPEIATILGLSPRTVQSHLDRIYRRLGVETRTAAVAVAYRAAPPTA